MSVEEYQKSMCYSCFWASFQKWGTGTRFYCRTEMHKITKGKKKCENFKWD